MYVFKTGRMKLPAWQQRGAIVSSVAKHGSIVIVGETGCGKVWFLMFKNIEIVDVKNVNQKKMF